MIAQIIQLLIAERDPLNRAIDALQGPAKAVEKNVYDDPTMSDWVKSKVKTASGPTKRKLSAAGRRAIIAALGATVRENGFDGLRASGCVGWVETDGDMSRFMEYETKVHCAIQDSRMMAVCTYPARSASLTASRELIHNHGKLFVKRGEWVHDNSRDAKKIEAVFTSLASMQENQGAPRNPATASA